MSGKSNSNDIELLEFPCEFPLKVFGLNDEGFEADVLELVRQHCPTNTEFQVTRNQSKQGKYQALTITFTAYSRQQLDDIYQSLTDSEQVVMSL
ncbi:MAG: DUF493 domain-containing protein [Gammaproteobacteria bacterium]|nr:DUF493 domain-containing protein [Gammaproteobacteria bacterium]